MFEQSKSAKRRFNDGNFHIKYLRGKGIDIGAGADCIGNNKHAFAGITEVLNWDLSNGDGQYLKGVPDNFFDFVHSSHSLEHMKDWQIAIGNWIRVCKPGGFIIITVPEEHMYEKDCWPSKFNPDHKWSFTLKSNSKMPKTINVLDLAKFFNDKVTVEKIENVDQFYYKNHHEIDQTRLANVECCIEIIFKKL